MTNHLCDCNSNMIVGFSSSSTTCERLLFLVYLSLRLCKRNIIICSQLINPECPLQLLFRPVTLDDPSSPSFNHLDQALHNRPYIWHRFRRCSSGFCLETPLLIENVWKKTCDMSPRGRQNLGRPHHVFFMAIVRVVFSRLNRRYARLNGWACLVIQDDIIMKSKFKRWGMFRSMNVRETVWIWDPLKIRSHDH